MASELGLGQSPFDGTGEAAQAEGESSPANHAGEPFENADHDFFDPAAEMGGDSKTDPLAPAEITTERVAA